MLWISVFDSSLFVQALKALAGPQWSADAAETEGTAAAALAVASAAKAKTEQLMVERANAKSVWQEMQELLSQGFVTQADVDKARDEYLNLLRGAR